MNVGTCRSHEPKISDFSIVSTGTCAPESTYQSNFTLKCKDPQNVCGY